MYKQIKQYIFGSFINRLLRNISSKARYKNIEHLIQNSQKIECLLIDILKIDFKKQVAQR